MTSAVFDVNAPITLTYNLTVADFHTYFVGEDGVLVHNGLKKGIGRGLAYVTAAMGLSNAADLSDSTRSNRACGAKIELPSTRRRDSLEGTSPPKDPWYNDYRKGDFRGIPTLGKK